MIVNHTKVETADKESRFILKRISTSSWDCLNRKMATTNQLRHYEEKREPFQKPLFESNFLTHHIRWNGKSGTWEFDGFGKAKADAQNQDRLFIPQRQMNAKLWNQQNDKQAFNQYEELVNLGVSIPTMNVPLKMKLEEWKKLRRDAESILKGTQRLMPIFSTRHDFACFPEIMDDCFTELPFVGVQLYGLTKPVEFVNLSALRKTNAGLVENQNAPLVFGFNHDRHLRKYSYVNSAFAYACFGVDIFSERQYFMENMTPAMIKQMLERSPDDYMFYDRSQGRFNRVAEQVGWHEVDLTRSNLKAISVEEGLNAYQSLVWANARNQQEDLSLLNGAIFQKQDIVKRIKDEKSGWAGFYQEIEARS